MRGAAVGRFNERRAAAFAAGQRSFLALFAHTFALPRKQTLIRPGYPRRARTLSHTHTCQRPVELDADSALSRARRGSGSGSGAGIFEGGTALDPAADASKAFSCPSRRRRRRPRK